MQREGIEKLIAGAGRTKVVLKNLTQSTSVDILVHRIVNGGFTYTLRSAA